MASLGPTFALIISDTTFATVTVALIASIPPTIAATAALIQGMKNANKADIMAKKADVLVETSEKIHTLTNSTLTEMTSKLQVAMEKISGLEKLVTALSNERAVATSKADEKQ